VAEALSRVVPDSNRRMILSIRHGHVRRQRIRSSRSSNDQWSMGCPTFCDQDNNRRRFGSLLPFGCADGRRVEEASKGPPFPFGSTLGAAHWSYAWCRKAPSDHRRNWWHQRCHDRQPWHQYFECAKADIGGCSCRWKVGIVWHCTSCNVTEKTWPRSGHSAVCQVMESIISQMIEEFVGKPQSIPALMQPQRSCNSRRKDRTIRSRLRLPIPKEFTCSYLYVRLGRL